jgi:hypothetical protein
MHRPPLGIGRPLAVRRDGVKAVVGSPSWIINRSLGVPTVRCRLMSPTTPAGGTLVGLPGLSMVAAAVRAPS